MTIKEFHQIAPGTRFRVIGDTVWTTDVTYIKIDASGMSHDILSRNAVSLVDGRLWTFDEYEVVSPFRVKTKEVWKRRDDSEDLDREWSDLYADRDDDSDFGDDDDDDDFLGDDYRPCCDCPCRRRGGRHD